MRFQNQGLKTGSFAVTLGRTPIVHVSSTDIEVTNGDGTWDTHLAKKLSRQSKRIEKPINPLPQFMGVILKWVLSLTVGLGGISLARSCFSLGASTE